MLVDDVRTTQFYDIYMPGLFIRGKIWPYSRSDS